MFIANYHDLFNYSWVTPLPGVTITTTTHSDATSTTSTTVLDSVHHFTGAPKDEEKKFPCGVGLVSKGKAGGWRLAGLPAATDVAEVTCPGCLRALIKK
jgi:hypothetical protein